MKKLNTQDIVELGCLILLYTIGYLSGFYTGKHTGFKKGVEVTAEYADSIYKENLDRCQSLMDSALYYRNYYYNMCQGLTPESKVKIKSK